MWLSSGWPTLAIPKSEILGFISESSKMLLGLRSLWIMFTPECKWRYSTPWAIPPMIRNNVSQFREPLELSSAKCLTGWINIIREDNWSGNLSETLSQSLCSRTCRIWICRGSCLACIRKPGPFRFLECNIPEASRCLCAEASEWV